MVTMGVVRKDAAMSEMVRGWGGVTGGGVVEVYCWGAVEVSWGDF